MSRSDDLALADGEAELRERIGDLEVERDTYRELLCVALQALHELTRQHDRQTAALRALLVRRLLEAHRARTGAA